MAMRSFLSKDELLKHPNYLLSTYQLEIYKQLSLYMKANDLKNKDVAKQLKVSGSYVSQILNGNFNFTLKKMIELGLLMGKIPYLEFIGFDEYWKRERKGDDAHSGVDIPAAGEDSPRGDEFTPGFR